MEGNLQWKTVSLERSFLRLGSATPQRIQAVINFLDNLSIMFEGTVHANNILTSSCHTSSVWLFMKATLSPLVF